MQSQMKIYIIGIKLCEMLKIAYKKCIQDLPFLKNSWYTLK